MLKIRLSRIGKKKKPMYRLTVAEQRKDTYGDALEILGAYNPFTKELDIKKERVEHWLANGAQMSPTVNNLLVAKEVIKGGKVRAYSPKKKEKEEGAAEGGAKPETKPDEPKAEPAKEEAPKEEAPKEEAKEKKPAEEKEEKKE